MNIHPAKREVKFHDERAVRQFVTQAIRRTLLKFHAGPSASRPAAGATHPAPAARSQPEPDAGGAPPATQELPSFTALTGTPLASRAAPALLPAPSARSSGRPSPSTGKCGPFVPASAVSAGRKSDASPHAAPGEPTPAAQRPAADARRDRPALRRARVRPRPGADGPARRARARSSSSRC